MKIKFRIYDKQEKKYLLFDFERDFSNFSPDLFVYHVGTPTFTEFRSDRYVFELFTGLLDKNGTEVYEGDRLRTPGNCLYNETIGQIVWCEDKASFMLEIKEHNLFWSINKEYIASTEVILEKSL